MSDLPAVISAEAAAAGDYVWCDVRWYMDGRSGHEAYLAGHVEGAIFVSLDDHLAAPASREEGRHPLPTAQQFARSLGELGISEHDEVVAYDDLGGFSAARFVWMLRAIGQSAALLDGGLAAATPMGSAVAGELPGVVGELSTVAVTRPAVKVPVREWPSELLADADLTAAAAVVIDARATERYRGDVELVDARPGHIPGAVNLPWEGNLDGDGRFLDPARLRERFRAVGEETIIYCGSGVSACHNLLALEHAGLDAAMRLYPGSWSQWSAQPERPAELGDRAN